MYHIIIYYILVVLNAFDKMYHSIEFGIIKDLLK